MIGLGLVLGLGAARVSGMIYIWEVSNFFHRGYTFHLLAASDLPSLPGMP